MESLDYKQAIKDMEKHGFKYTAENHAKNVLFFLKTFDNRNLHIHAKVTLATHLIDLDTQGNLDLGVTLSCDSIDIENNKFPEFEKKLLNYLYLCVYGKPIHSVEGDTDNGLHFQTEGEAINRGQSIGGAKTGEGKPEKPTVTIEDRKKKFWDVIKQVGKEKGLEKEMCKSFWDYWTEMNPGGKKMRFEMEKIFDVSRRLKTWLENDKKWLPIWKQKEQEKAKIEEKQLKSTNKNLKKYEDLF